MKKFLKRILNVLAYVGAGIVILLAIMVGLFRLFLPKLPEYQEDIKAWANAAIGLEVEFAGMNARWRLSGPELNFYEAELSLPTQDEALFEASEVTIGVGLLRLLTDRTLVVDRILVRETNLIVERDAENQLHVQGLSLDELAQLVPASGEGSDVEVIAQDVAVVYRQAPDLTGNDGRVPFEISMLRASRDNEALSIEASLDLDERFGSRLDVSADQQLSDADELPVWQLYLEARSLGLARWSELLPPSVARVVSGTGDVSLWIEMNREALLKATANVAIDNLAIEGAGRGAPLDVEGRLEYSDTGTGLLVAAENFRMRTVDNEWPRSSIQLQLRRDTEGAIGELDASASFVRMDDVAYLSPWLPVNVRSLLDRYRPSGEISDLRLGLDGLTAERTRFDVAATLTEAGIRAQERLPGVRGFSGRLRADVSGGRIEFESSNLRLNIPEYLSEMLIFDDAIGTVIWRRSADGITILSDRMQLRNADFDSRSSLQVTLPNDDGSPFVDLESLWSINDVDSVKRFLPKKVIHPDLHRWLDTALLSGRMTRGTTVLAGPLDRFPFDDGDGEFRITATMQDGVMRYASGWPEAVIRTMDVVLDGTRLYSQRNAIVTADNSVADAHIEIANVRAPVLTIDAFATGTLNSIRTYARNSPISRVFGGRLDDVEVAGDASFRLELNYPLRDRQNYSFRTRIQASSGSVRLVGFDPPVTELNGIVNISRAGVSSEALFGMFLGEPVSIELSSTADETSSYGVVAQASGRLTAAGLVDGLQAPLEQTVDGATPYVATLRFPRPDQPLPPPVQLTVTSDLEGFAVDLPAPLRKAADSTLPLSLAIKFPEAGRIASSGSLGDNIRWISDFHSTDAGWDFDRGALALGGDYPDVPGSRGLHVHGQAETVNLGEWLELAQGGQAAGGIGDRIRNIDLVIDNLYVFGQHFLDHRVTVDRAGSEWFVHTDGEQLAGDVRIPYDLRGGNPVTLELERLILPGDDSEDRDSDPTAIDPRTLPGLSIKVGEFALGERFLGAVEAEFRHTADGLRADRVYALDETFNIEGSAGWVIDPRRGLGPRSYVAAKLTSSDVQKTMGRLNYDVGIDSDDMEIEFDLQWPGGPHQDLLEDLDGNLSVRFGSGQLNEVEPGAGRVFGLMSVVALPRRLSLDFRDVLDKGFGFDEILGTFVIDSGDAFTCDLSLKGPAADIGIVGRAGLAAGDYDQTALVSANVGNTLPVVGAVVAGPQVAAALLIFSQIFKKPLQEMGQVYYGIQGSMDDPLVEVADAGRFATTSELAGCLNDAQ